MGRPKVLGGAKALGIVKALGRAKELGVQLGISGGLHCHTWRYPCFFKMMLCVRGKKFTIKKKIMTSFINIYCY